MRIMWHLIYNIFGGKTFKMARVLKVKLGYSGMNMST